MATSPATRSTWRSPSSLRTAPSVEETLEPSTGRGSGFAGLRPSRFSTESLLRVNPAPIGRRHGVGKYARASDERSVEMPYKQITQLPDNVKNNLPKHAQEIYKEAFNSAEDQYGEEDRAHRVAWSAVEN